MSLTVLSGVGRIALLQLVSSAFKKLGELQAIKVRGGIPGNLAEGATPIGSFSQGPEQHSSLSLGEFLADQLQFLLALCTQFWISYFTNPTGKYVAL